MSPGARDGGSRFVRALVRSASVDVPARGAVARARARLGVEDDAPAPGLLGLAGVLLLGAVACAMGGWGPGGTMSAARSPAECHEGIEAPPCTCAEPSRTTALRGTNTGSSSGAEPLSPGSSGG